MKQGSSIQNRERNVLRQIRNVRKLWESQPTFGRSRRGTTHPCTMSAVTPYTDESTNFLYWMRIATNSEYDFHLTRWWARKGKVLDKVSPINSYGRKIEWEFRISPKIRESSPNNQLKLIWISPVRNCVPVDCNLHVNTVHDRDRWK